MSHTVVNVRGMPPDSPGVVYCGRACAGWSGSPLANPYHLRRESDRAGVIARYRDWLEERIAADDRVIITALLSIHPDAALGCWCSPKLCHADVIAEVATRLREFG
jgi:hypothetical protein